MPTDQSQQIADGFVRLAEKAVIEYAQARSHLIRFLDEDGFFDDYFRAQDHFETSVQTLHRALNYLERLRRSGIKVGGVSLVPKVRDLEVLHQASRRAIREFRDMSEHLDEDIVQGVWPSDRETAIHLGWERAQLGSLELRYVDYVRWLNQLVQLGEKISQVVIRSA